MTQLTDKSKETILEDGEKKFWEKEFSKIPRSNLLYRRGHWYPFYLFTSTKNNGFELGKNLIIASWSNKGYELPNELKKIKKALIQEEINRRKRLSLEWWSDLQCRLRAIGVSGAYDEEIVNLHLETAYYEDHFVSNIHLNKPVLPGRKTIREKFIKEFEDITDFENSKLANQLATNTFIVNRKQMKGIIGVRSRSVAFRRGYYCITGGYITVKSDRIVHDLDDKGVPDPFKAAIREASNETGLSIDKISCLGIGVDPIYGYPDMLFLAETSQDVEDALPSPKVEYELDPIFVDLKNPDEVFAYLDPKYIGTHDAACVILSVEKLLPEIYLRKENRKKMVSFMALDKEKDKKVLYARVWTVKIFGNEISKFEADQIIKEVKDNGGLVIEKTGDFYKIFFGDKGQPNSGMKYVLPIIEHTLKNGGVGGDIYELLSVTCNDKSILQKLKELKEMRSNVKKLRFSTDDEAWRQAEAATLHLEDKLSSLTDNLRSDISRSVNLYLKPLKTKITAPMKGARSIRERAEYRLHPPISFVFVEY